MDQVMLALGGAGRVLLAGLLLGAGLPAIYAFGIRAMAWGTGGEAEVHEEGVVLKPHPLGRVIAWFLFGIVILAVLLGIGYIVAHGIGWSITFNGIIPVFSPKA